MDACCGDMHTMASTKTKKRMGMMVTVMNANLKRSYLPEAEVGRRGREGERSGGGAKGSGGQRELPADRQAAVGEGIGLRRRDLSEAPVCQQCHSHARPLRTRSNNSTRRFGTILTCCNRGADDAWPVALLSLCADARDTCRRWRRLRNHPNRAQTGEIDVVSARYTVASPNAALGELTEPHKHGGARHDLHATVLRQVSNIEHRRA